MKKLILCSLTFLLLAITTFSCKNSSSKESETEMQQEIAIYQCPMDCENGKTYDKSGKCAVCEMDLEKK